MTDITSFFDSIIQIPITWFIKISHLHTQSMWIRVPFFGIEDPLTSSYDCAPCVLLSHHSLRQYFHSQTTTDTAFISHPTTHRHWHTTCCIPLCLWLFSCQSHCWFLLHLRLNCILPRLNWSHYCNREVSLWIKAWKSASAVPWLGDMFCMIQCLFLEMSHSRILDRADVSPKAEFPVWR